MKRRHPFATLLVMVLFSLLMASTAPLLTGQALASCTEAVGDGGFEYIAFWQMGRTPRPPAYTREERFSGLQALRLGIPPTQADAYSWSSTRQWITIPADTTSALLTFWYQPHSEEPLWRSASEVEWRGYGIDRATGLRQLTSAGLESWAAYDWQECLLLDEGGAVLTTVMRETSRTGVWTRRTADLTAFRGRRVALYFNVLNNGSGAGRTWMYLDEVSLQLCTGGVGSVSGTALLQGRLKQQGAQVTSSGGGSALTNEVGAFTLADLPTGSYRVTASLPGYLSSYRDGVSIWPGQTTLLPNTELLGGDANRDQLVDLWDLVLIASCYAESPPHDLRGDITGDGVVTLTDVVLAGVNYDRRGPTAWGIPYTTARIAAPQGRVELVLQRDRLQIIAHELQGVRAIACRLSGAPALWRLAESKAASSPLLETQPHYVLRREIQPVSGQFLYVATLLGGDSLPASEGVLLELPLRGIASDAVAAVRGELLLANDAGQITALKIGGEPVDFAKTSANP